MSQTEYTVSIGEDMSLNASVTWITDDQGEIFATILGQFTSNDPVVLSTIERLKQGEEVKLVNGCESNESLSRMPVY